MSLYARPSNARLRATGARMAWIAVRNSVFDLAATITGLRIGGGKCRTHLNSSTPGHRAARGGAPRRLCDDPAGVVADQHHVLEVKGGENVGDHAGDARDGSIRAGTKRLRMRAERPGGRCTQAQPGESFAHLAPQFTAIM